MTGKESTYVQFFFRPNEVQKMWGGRGGERCESTSEKKRNRWKIICQNETKEEERKKERGRMVRDVSSSPGRPSSYTFFCVFFPLPIGKKETEQVFLSVVLQDFKKLLFLLIFLPFLSMHLHTAAPSAGGKFFLSSLPEDIFWCTNLHVGLPTLFSLSPTLLLSHPRSSALMFFYEVQVCTLEEIEQLIGLGRGWGKEGRKSFLSCLHT